MKQFSYKGRVAQELQASHYPADGSTAWFIGEGEDRVVLTVCAIDLGFDVPAAGYLYIRDWSYTEGVAAALEEQGIVEIVTRVTINEHGSKIAIVRVLQ